MSTNALGTKAKKTTKPENGDYCWCCLSTSDKHRWNDKKYLRNETYWHTAAYQIPGNRNIVPRSTECMSTYRVIRDEGGRIRTVEPTPLCHCCHCHYRFRWFRGIRFLGVPDSRQTIDSGLACRAQVRVVSGRGGAQAHRLPGGSELFLYIKHGIVSVPKKKCCGLRICASCWYTCRYTSYPVCPASDKYWLAPCARPIMHKTKVHAPVPRVQLNRSELKSTNVWRQPAWYRARQQWA